MSLAEAPRPTGIRRDSPAELVCLPIPAPAQAGNPRQDLCASVGDAAAHSVMVGIGETYIAAFALALSTGETFAGLVVTLPMLAGATLQLATPWVLGRCQSYRQWVVLCARLQAAALLLMPVAACFSGQFAAAWIFFAASAYWAAAQAGGPAWNTWIEEVIPRRIRSRFLARRVRISQICTLAGFAAGGIGLELGQSRQWLMAAFAGVFFAAAAGRLVSSWFLSRHSEPSRGKYSLRHVSWREFISRTRSSSGGRLVLYLLAVQTAVQISGPYFAPYMLAQEGLSYFSYMVLVGVAYVGKVIALPFWGKVAHYAGARRLLWIGGTAIIPVAALWIGTELCGSWPVQMAYLCFVQLISGIVWAAYELAMLLMFFEAIPRRERASVLTIYNFGNAAALVLGSLIGAAILQIGGESHVAYLVVFGGSSLARVFTTVLLRGVPERHFEVVRSELSIAGANAEHQARAA